MNSYQQKTAKVSPGSGDGAQKEQEEKKEPVKKDPKEGLSETANEMFDVSHSTLCTVQMYTTPCLLYKCIQHLMYCTNVYNTLFTVQMYTTPHVLYKCLQHLMYCTSVHNGSCTVQVYTTHHVLYKCIQLLVYHTLYTNNHAARIHGVLSVCRQ